MEKVYITITDEKGKILENRVAILKNYWDDKNMLVIRRSLERLGNNIENKKDEPIK